MTPEAREKARQRAADWRAALAKDPKALAAYQARNAARARARRAEAAALRPGPLAGSVLHAAAPGNGRDLLAAITAAAGRLDDKDEVVAEAALLALEGMAVGEAVVVARRNVLRSAKHLRYSVPVEACTWL